MNLIIALASAVAFALLLREPIRKFPVVFYVLAIAVDIVFLTQAISSFSAVAGRALFPFMQQGLFAFGLLSVVMFIGVLPEGSRPKRYLRPVRGELSIIASILIVGHVLNYFQPIFMRAFMGAGVKTSVFAGVALSVVLVVLLAVLTITSFRHVRNVMDAAMWKRVQLLAYPFYVLVFCHIMAMLMPAALNGAGRAVVVVVLYVVLLIAYAGLRLWRVSRDRGRSAAQAPQEAEAAK